jgi:hypothetical protein
MGNVQEAIHLEQQALDLMKDATPKQRKDYEESMAKFKAGQSVSRGEAKSGAESGSSGNKQATGK